MGWTWTPRSVCSQLWVNFASQHELALGLPVFGVSFPNMSIFAVCCYFAWCVFSLFFPKYLSWVWELFLCDNLCAACCNGTVAAIGSLSLLWLNQKSFRLLQQLHPVYVWHSCCLWACDELWAPQEPWVWPGQYIWWEVDYLWVTFPVGAKQALLDPLRFLHRILCGGFLTYASSKHIT